MKYMFGGNKESLIFDLEKDTKSTKSNQFGMDLSYRNISMFPGINV